MLASRAILAAVLAAALAGCALKAPPETAELRKQAMPGVQVPGAWTAAGAAAGAVADGWLAGFNDPQLDALVQEALANNPDLMVAAARVEQAAAYVKIAGASLYPAVQVLGTASGKGGDAGGINYIGLFANWELDLWGRVRAGREAATLQYTSAELDLAYARQSLAAMVAKSWFLASEARLQGALAAEMVRSAEQLLEMARVREKVGSGSELDTSLARASLESFRDAERQLRLAYEQSLRALELLAGRYPAAAESAPAALAALPGPVPAGLPSELLERRPDVVAAERRVAAAFYRKEEAKAAMLPRISLTAAVNSLSSDVVVLKERDNPVWGIGGKLAAPIFQGYALEGQVEVRTAEQKQAVAEYGRIGSKAFGEVEGALSAESAARDRQAILARGVADNQRAVELTEVRYRVGAGDLRAVTQQQLALYATRSALLRVQSEVLVQRVNLHLALGGSFGKAVKVSADGGAAPGSH
jgi:NodT family efflux transporter outer membrane factor (OMF) lipoprotein